MPELSERGGPRPYIGQIFESMHGAPGETRELVLESNGVRFTVTAPITAF